MPKEKPPHRPLTPDEEDVWQETASLVTPLGARERQSKKTSKTKRVVSNNRPVRADMPQQHTPLPELSTGKYAGVDSGTRERLRRGNYPIDARLDLHGYTQVEALEKITNFIHHHYLEQHRCLLVVTGKGSLGVDKTVPRRGILRESLPDWLAGEALRPYILAFDKAHIKHGGNGAYYVLLKRRR